MHYENGGYMKFLNEQNTLHYISKNGIQVVQKMSFNLYTKYIKIRNYSAVKNRNFHINYLRNVHK